MMYVLLILGMTVVTFLPRYLPLHYAARINLPLGVKRGLTYVPIAVLTIIVVQTSLLRDGHLAVTYDNPYIWASLAGGLTALVQQRLLLTVSVGMAVYVVLRFFVFGG